MENVDIGVYHIIRVMIHEVWLLCFSDWEPVVGVALRECRALTSRRVTKELFWDVCNFFVEQKKTNPVLVRVALGA